MFLAYLFKKREKWQHYMKKMRAAKTQQDEIDEAEKPFINHLDDLRKTLIGMFITIVVSLIVVLIFRQSLFTFLRLPLDSAGLDDLAKALPSLRPYDSVALSLKICFYASLALSSPLQLFFLARFVLPALRPREKRAVSFSLAFGALLFLGGASFCFAIVLPRILDFFHGDAIAMGMAPSWTADRYYSFVIMMILVFGFAFELPVVVLLLAAIEIIDSKLMRGSRSYAIIIILVLSAILTPTTDPLTMLLLCAPLVLLYELCIWISFFMEKKAARK